MLGNTSCPFCTFFLLSIFPRSRLMLSMFPYFSLAIAISPESITQYSLLTSPLQLFAFFMYRGTMSGFHLSLGDFPGSCPSHLVVLLPTSGFGTIPKYCDIFLTFIFKANIYLIHHSYSHFVFPYMLRFLIACAPSSPRYF